MKLHCFSKLGIGKMFCERYLKNRDNSYSYKKYFLARIKGNKKVFLLQAFFK